jgi:hypothetical protein
MPEPTVLPHRATDAHGRLIPLTDAQIRERNAEAIRALDEAAAIVGPDDTDERWADIYRGIDEGRPHRKLFEGMY